MSRDVVGRWRLPGDDLVGFEDQLEEAVPAELVGHAVHGGAGRELGPRGAGQEHHGHPIARTQALRDRGARLFVCAYGCQKRRIPLKDSDRVTYCGLVVLTDLINGTDRFVALN